MSRPIDDEDIYYSDSDDNDDQTGYHSEALSTIAEDLNENQLNDTYELSERELAVTDHCKSDDHCNGKCEDVSLKCCDLQTDGSEQMWPTIEKRLFEKYLRRSPLIDAIKSGFDAAIDELVADEQTLSLSEWYSQLKNRFESNLRESTFADYNPNYSNTVLSELSDVLLNESACDQSIRDPNDHKCELSSQTDISGDILSQYIYSL